MPAKASIHAQTKSGPAPTNTKKKPFSTSEEDLQRNVYKLQETSQSFRMKSVPSKTKSMDFRRKKLIRYKVIINGNPEEQIRKN